ncbi:epoxide hydrolase family protein [Deminuibacter soli]|uniref:Epoxide hydrolase n=1 Tax=Deminuibacter soli TaxID=2291815 RepID=A0A3E1NE97_9BACT|nr:epoxide hydrolase family protein [Deminuibacter soli]RFM26172.1 epoxide hydrolase [Deminuibacter soli]
MKHPFQITIPSSVIDDLKNRLAATRWTDEIENEKWDYGTNKTYLKELCLYWEKTFNWQKQEEYLNSFPQFKTTINKTEIHFLYQKGEGQNAIPLLLTHGYPDSFVRFLKLIPLLTKADESGLSFDVIVPSIPGYGFSEIPTQKGMNTKKIAGLFADLMRKELAYEKFAAHGGDWGSSITEQLALYHESSLLCIHLTDVPFGHGIMPLEDPSKSEEKFQKKTQRWVQTEGAYSAIQSTKPQSLSYGLNDSPAGLAGWIIEKFYTWSDNHRALESVFTKDELLTNLTIYWATQTINSSFRIYHEEIQEIMQAIYNPLVKFNPLNKAGDKTKIPTAFALFPKDISIPPRAYAERFFNVQRWTEMAAGGHFAAMEQPALLAEDIRKFIAAVKYSISTAMSE